MSSSIDNTDITTVCAACGKEGGNLNTCNKCKMVTYCNAACKKKHRSKHKKACERRVAELHDEELFKDPPPPEDCPICFLPLPLDAGQTTFKSCCGKIICCGCIYAMDVSGGNDICAFCRVQNPSSNADRVKRIKKLMECNNANAIRELGGYYADGDGMPQDMTKANELFLRAGELGCADAYYNLGNSYRIGRGVEVDKEKAKYYWGLAAMNGDVRARHNLGCWEGDAGNEHRAYKHFVLAAKAGSKNTMDMVKEGFMDGIVAKDEYANTLRTCQERHDEMKSDDRDKAEAYQTQRGW